MNTFSPNPLSMLERWDAQQTAYIKYRDQRFEVMTGCVAGMVGTNPRVLDLACGPGSLSAAMLGVLPEARIVGVDKDPLLLQMARRAFAGHDNVDVIGADLDDPAWLNGVEGTFDAVLSSTALHWLNPDILTRLYFQLADRIRPGGIFLNADHLFYDPVSQPRLRDFAFKDYDAVQAEAFAAGVDTWEGWWKLADSMPEFAEASRERAVVWAAKSATPKVTLGFHIETLRSAGFAEVGTLWQYLDDYVICAVR